jgi:hypothetical protein
MCTIQQPDAQKEDSGSTGCYIVEWAFFRFMTLWLDFYSFVFGLPVRSSIVWFPASSG